MTKTEAQSVILRLVADHGIEAVRDLVTEWSNASEVDIDGEGDIWIAGPQTGHWLDEQKLSEFAGWAMRR